MEEHSRFDEEHRMVCEECYSDYADFCMDTARDHELDMMMEEA